MKFFFKLLKYKFIWILSKYIPPFLILLFSQLLIKIQLKSIFRTIDIINHPILYYFIFILNLIFIIFFLIVVFSNPGKLEDILNLIPQNLIEKLPLCSECNLPKPNRTHHCKFCNKCHLRMDHHCPSLGNCIGLGNHQYFMIMLLWSNILIFYFIFLILKIKPLFKGIKFYYYFLFMDIILFLTILIFYLIQFFQITKNITTFEKIFKNPKIYNLGFKKNLSQIFGNSIINFFIPKKSNLKGFEWNFDEFVINNYFLFFFFFFLCFIK